MIGVKALFVKGGARRVGDYRSPFIFQINKY